MGFFWGCRAVRGLLREFEHTSTDLASVFVPSGNLPDPEEVIEKERKYCLGLSKETG